jgi:hypothetical protein
MDANTRRQLRTNELADALASLKDLRDPRFLWSAGVVVVVGIAVLAWYGWRSSQQSAAARDWEHLSHLSMELTGDDASRVAAAQNELRNMLQGNMTAHAKGYAELALARSRVADGLVHPDQRPAAFEEAVDILERLRSDPGTTPMLQAAATFLLASAEESLQRLERAKELYESLRSDPRCAGSPYRQLAEARLKDVDTLSKPVVFTPGDPPPPPPPAPMVGPPAPPASQSSVVLNPSVSRSLPTPPSMMGPPAPPPTPAPTPPPEPAPQGQPQQTP